jgi:hypothetical protein
MYLRAPDTLACLTAPAMPGMLTGYVPPLLPPPPPRPPGSTSAVYRVRTRLSGSPPFFPALHASVLVAPACPQGAARLYDLLPLSPRDPRVLAEMLAGRAVPARCRVRKVRAGRWERIAAAGRARSGVWLKRVGETRRGAEEVERWRVEAGWTDGRLRMRLWSAGNCYAFEDKLLSFLLSESECRH